MYSRKVVDVEGLAAAATKHLELLKQKDEAESSFVNTGSVFGKRLAARSTETHLKTDYDIILH